MDINPWTKGHALVIPRAHSRTSTRSTTQDLAATPLGRPRRSRGRMRERFECDGVNLINACEPAAWQTVWHFHIHVIPRYAGDGLAPPTHPQTADQDELAALAAELTR